MSEETNSVLFVTEQDKRAIDDMPLEIQAIFDPDAQAELERQQQAQAEYAALMKVIDRKFGKVPF